MQKSKSYWVLRVPMSVINVEICSWIIISSVFMVSLEKYLKSLFWVRVSKTVSTVEKRASPLASGNAPRRVLFIPFLWWPIIRPSISHPKLSFVTSRLQSVCISSLQWWKFADKMTSSTKSWHKTAIFCKIAFIDWPNL